MGHVAFCRRLLRVRDANLRETSPLRHLGERGSFGRAAREHVDKYFLTPRLVRDELELIKELVGGGE
jgi:hypothetical protein